MGRVVVILVVGLVVGGCALEVGGKGGGRDCRALREAQPGLTSGVQTLSLGPRTRPMPVWCEMTLAGGGWTLWLSDETGTFAGNEGMPRCGASSLDNCVAGTYVQRGLRRGLFLFYSRTEVYELGTDLALHSVRVAAETHGDCSDVSCALDSLNCLFSTLQDGPGCCMGSGPQNNICLQ